MKLKNIFLIILALLVFIFIWLWQTESNKLDNMQSKLAVAQTQYAENKDSLNKTEDINNRQKTELTQLKDKTESLTSDLLNRVEKQSQLEASVMGAEKLLAAAREELKITKNQLKQLQINYNDTSRKNIEINTELNKYKNETIKFKETVVDGEKKMEPCLASTEDVENHRLLAEAASLKLEVTKAQAELNNLNTKLSSDYQKLVQLKKEIAFLNLSKKPQSTTESIFQNLIKNLQIQVESEKIALNLSDNIIKININNNLIFAEGTANLSPEGLRILSLINQSFENSQIKNIEIINYSGLAQASKQYKSLYPSKWEFSSAMAATLAFNLEKLENLKNSQITAIGKADSQVSSQGGLNGEFTEIIFTPIL